jgi:hypothetical protein
MTRDLLQDAQAVQELLENPDHWCQHRELRHDYLDGQVHARWCLRGAAIVVTAGHRRRLARLLGLLQWTAGPWVDLVAWNDDRARTHDHVRALLAAAVGEAHSRLTLLPTAPPPVDRIVEADDHLHRRGQKNTTAAVLVAIGDAT